MPSFKIHVIRTGDSKCRVQAEAYEKRADSGEIQISPGLFKERIDPLKTEIRRSYDIRSVASLDDGEVDSDPPLETRPRRVRLKRRRARTDLKVAQDVGSELFDFLFNGRIGDFFRQSVQTAQGQGDLLPVRLCVEHSLLADVPWETMYDRQEQTYLSLSQLTPLTRSIPAEDIIFAKQSKPPLNVLGMVARPKSIALTTLGPIDAESELDGLKEAVKNLKAEFVWTPTGTQLELETMLLRRSWSVHVGVSAWIGKQLLERRSFGGDPGFLLSNWHRWPAAAWYDGKVRRAVNLGAWPVARKQKPLADFLSKPGVLLSARNGWILQTHHVQHPFVQAGLCCSGPATSY